MCLSSTRLAVLEESIGLGCLAESVKPPRTILFGKIRLSGRVCNDFSQGHAAKHCGIGYDKSTALGQEVNIPAVKVTRRRPSCALRMGTL
jgi:hypothetical protein